MRASEPISGDRERRLDEAVLAYLKAREGNAALDEQAWIDRYPDLRAELADFFQNHNRIDLLAGMLHRLTDAAEPRPAGEATLAWAGADASKFAASLQAQQVMGDYELLEEIGKGGMGLVYKARQRSLKRVVALKMILAGARATSEELARFRSEAEAVAQLRHPHIVQIYEVGELDGSPFFSLEFVEGGSLKGQLDGTPLPPRTTAQLMRTLAEAVQFAHHHGIIHRDLKPANILLATSLGQSLSESKLFGSTMSEKATSPSSIHSTPSGSRQRPPFVPKITDFGLAKRLDEDSGQTKSGTIVGTPSYMAPEQAAGQKHRVGPATDIYGLGAVLYELLTGRPPFKAATSWETVNQVLHNEPAAPRLLDPKVNRDLETICLKCLQKDPQRRYESAQALGDDLQRYLEGRPIQARPVASAVKFWRLCRRHPGTAISLTFAFLSLLVFLVAIAFFNHRLKRELNHNAEINRELQLTLTKQIADRIDSDLSQLSRIPMVMATVLSSRSDWREDQLAPLMRDLLSKDDRLFGTAIAFEPQQFDAQREDFCLYACRGTKGITTKLLLPPRYDYREEAWYKSSKACQCALWTEPFLDVEGGDIPMVTHSVPIWRGNKVAGIVTVDLSMAYFDAMDQWLKKVRMGKKGYAFVISHTGAFIGHPDPKFPMGLKITDSQEFQADSALQELTASLLKREKSSLRAIDPSTGRQSRFYFAPIASVQWSFVAVTED